MVADRAVLLLLILATLGLTGCSRMPTEAPRGTPSPYIPPEISRETLNNLLRPGSRKVPQPAPESGLWAHKVRNRGETLFSIALWYTGSGMNWPRLAEANPGITPHRIRPGDTILIPEKLLKTRRPIPAGFPNPKHKRRIIKKARPQPANPPVKDEETQLFGPIENDLRHAGPEKTELPVPLETLD